MLNNMEEVQPQKTKLSQPVGEESKELVLLREENDKLRTMNKQQAVEISDLKKALQKVIAKWMEVENESDEAKSREKTKPIKKEPSKPEIKEPTFKPPTDKQGNLHLKRKKSFSGLTDLPTSINTKKRRLQHDKEKSNNDKQSDKKINVEKLLGSEVGKDNLPKVIATKKNICKVCEQEDCDCSDELDFTVMMSSAKSIGDRVTRNRPKETNTNHTKKPEAFAAGGGILKREEVRHQVSNSKPFVSSGVRNRNHKTKKMTNTREPNKEFIPSKQVVHINFSGLPMQTTNKTVLGALKAHLGVQRVKLSNRIEIINGTTIMVFEEEEIARRLLNTLPFKVFNTIVDVQEQKEPEGGMHLYLSGLPLKTSTKILLGALRNHLNVNRLPIKDRVQVINGCSVVKFEDIEMANYLLNSQPFHVFDRIINITNRHPWLDMEHMPHEMGRGPDFRHMENNHHEFGRFPDLRHLPDIRDVQVNRHEMRYRPPRDRYDTMM